MCKNTMFEDEHELLDQLKEFVKTTGGSTGHVVTKLRDTLKAVESRSLFKVGDDVILTVTPNTDNGWKSYRHILVEGALGVIRSTHYYADKDAFAYWVNFNNSSWIDEKDVIHTKDGDRSPSFSFREKSLRKAGMPLADYLEEQDD